jgi:hypothetical protein
MLTPMACRHEESTQDASYGGPRSGAWVDHLELYEVNCLGEVEETYAGVEPGVHWFDLSTPEAAIAVIRPLSPRAPADGGIRP